MHIEIILFHDRPVAIFLQRSTSLIQTQRSNMRVDQRKIERRQSELISISQSNESSSVESRISLESFAVWLVSPTTVIGSLRQRRISQVELAEPGNESRFSCSSGCHVAVVWSYSETWCIPSEVDELARVAERDVAILRYSGYTGRASLVGFDAVVRVGSNV